MKGLGKTSPFHRYTNPRLDKSVYFWPLGSYLLLISDYFGSKLIARLPNEKDHLNPHLPSVPVNWISPFPILVGSSVLFHFNSISNR